MSDVKFSKEHEWIKVDDNIATIGITKHATEMLGDIVFVELPRSEEHTSELQSRTNLVCRLLLEKKKKKKKK